MLNRNEIRAKKSAKTKRRLYIQKLFKVAELQRKNYQQRLQK